MQYQIAPVVLATVTGSCLSGGAAAQQFPAEFELSSIDGMNGFVINAPRGLGFEPQGLTFASAGDVNGDGFDDVIIGVYYRDSGAGRGSGENYVVFGGEAVGSTGSMDISAFLLDGTNGFDMGGIESFDQCGENVSSAGDINGDGVDDIIIGATAADPYAFSGDGVCYVVFGSAAVGSSGSVDFETLDGTNGFVIYGSETGHFFGHSATVAGDVNNDGVDDLILGARFADPNGNDNAGVSYVIFGGTSVGSSGLFDLGTLNGLNGYAINGVDAGDRSGQSVAPAGDVNGDGVDDMIIGADRADASGNDNAGKSYVVYGGASVGSTGAINLSSLDGTNGFVLHGIEAGDRSGERVAAAGDVNGDGLDDLIIGASYAGPNGNDFAGQSYVVFGGAPVGPSGTIELSMLNGTNGFVLNGIDNGDRSGQYVSTAGDVNGDGVDDLIIGAPSADPQGSRSGESYVVYGDASLGSSGLFDLSTLDGTNGFVVNGQGVGKQTGFPVAPGGDVNGDGMDDILVGAYKAGSYYVIFGRKQPCQADVNGDGALTPTDFTAWIGAFNANAQECDQNGDGGCTATDFTAWIANYNAGCS